MDASIIHGLLAIAALLTLGAVGVPVAYSMISVGALGMWLIGGFDFMTVTLGRLPYSILSDYSFAVIPMFILMGTLAAAAGITTELYDIFNKLLIRLRGGLYMTTVIASGVFAAISGSTIVNSAVFTKIAMPEMLRHGYNKGLSAGCIAGAGTFAALIPPSISMVIVAMLTDASIGVLLIAGILPGLLTILVYIVGIGVLVRIWPSWAPKPTVRYSFKEQAAGIGKLLPTLLLIGIVLGGIYSGFMFPSAAGAVGAMGALCIGLMRRKLRWGSFKESVISATKSSAILLLIIIGGLILSRFLVFSGFVSHVSTAIESWGLTTWQLLVVISIFYLILGMFIDPTSMMLVTIPFIFPIASAVGIDVIWFAVIIVKLVELAAITPPVGINLFTVMAASENKVSSSEIFRGVLPFVFLELIVLAMLIAFPQISTFLPSRM